MGKIKYKYVGGYMAHDKIIAHKNEKTGNTQLLEDHLLVVAGEWVEILYGTFRKEVDMLLKYVISNLQIHTTNRKRRYDNE